MKIAEDFKELVLAELFANRDKFGGTDSAYAKKWGISPSVYSRLKGGERGNLLAETVYLNIGRELDITTRQVKWNIARTDVFEQLYQEIMFCKNYSQAKIFVDDTSIGKTETAKYMAKTVPNCFRIDCSQAKTKQLFIRTVAQSIGLDSKGKYAELKANIKYYLKTLHNPIVILDEAGDLDYPAFLEIKELWNATEDCVGWYMMGAEGLRQKITDGISNKRVGFREIFARFADKYSTVVPIDPNKKLEFYKKLLGDVIHANVTDQATATAIIHKCLTKDANGVITGLRRAKTLVLIKQSEIL